MKKSILFNSHDHGLSQGYQVLKRNILYSGVFEYDHAPMPTLPKNYWRKEEGFCLAIIDGVTAAFDANGGCYNIKAMYEDGMFDTVFKDVQIIIKTQFRHHPFWEEFTANTGIKVVSWIMWSTCNFPMSCFKWNPETNFKYIASCAGGKNSNRRWGRPPYIEHCKSDPSFHTERLPVDQFVEVLKECKWGLILQGGNTRNCDGKNTREVEYASCGIPMVLNYIPAYEYPFTPGKHFFLLESPKDLEKLKYTDPRPFAEASARLWEEYLKPESAAKYLLRLIHE